MPTKDKGDGCCGIEFLKSALYLFNCIFWLSGVAILGIAIWTIISKFGYISLLNSITYAATTYILLGAGVLIIIVGIIGCLGTVRENRCLLMTFATLLLLVFLLEAIAGAMAYIYESQVHDELVNSLNHTMLHSYSSDRYKTIAVDDLHQTFECCGAGSFEDWRYSKWLKEHRIFNITTPDSCCKTVSVGCAVRDHPSNIYYQGCIYGLQAYLKRHLIILGAVGLGLCALQLFGIIFACCLAKKINERKGNGMEPGTPSWSY